MQIRDKLSLLFTLIVSLLLGTTFLVIYFQSSAYRKEEFYDRLYSKSSNTANLLIEVDEVDASLLQLIESSNPISLPFEQTYIYNFRDTLLYSSQADSAYSISQEEINTIRVSEDPVRFYQNDLEFLGYLFIGTHDRFVVITGAKDIYGLSKLNNLRNTLLFVFMAALLITYAAGQLFARRALRPISKLVRQVDQIEIGNLDEKLDEGNGTDEIARLAITFNQMLARLQQSFALQKNFISNASHELRTPLTAIGGQLEVLLRQPREKEEYEKTLYSTLEDIKSLSHMLNRLLLLSQANSDLSKASFTDIRIDEVLWQAVAEVQKREKEYSIHLDFNTEIDAEILSYKGSDTLLQIAFVNLIENACKYSPSHGVRIILTRDSSFLMLHFSDQGIGIPADELERIFEPFQRGKNALIYPGHGIGLSLVERIVILHGGQVKAHSEVGKGSTFTISLPIYTI